MMPAMAPIPLPPLCLDPPTIGEPRTYWRDRPSSVSVTVRDTNLETVNLLTPDLRVVEGESITLELARSGRESPHSDAGSDRDR